jgi:hypothetical protein
MKLDNNGRDPNMRRRLDGQEMLHRDEQVARLREQGVPFRVIAARLGCSLGSVQKALRRVQARRADRALAGRPMTWMRSRWGRSGSSGSMRWIGDLSCSPMREASGSICWTCIGMAALMVGRCSPMLSASWRPLVGAEGAFNRR